ncbi:Uncharacterized protein Adt_31594 [Abeliophyllum distichum]|uniref:Uncharacterized protein n=1 Tax=Abeliophyllum distichum TaxID=126358 RepID=A0ABD1REP7_9LAMI
MQMNLICRKKRPNSSHVSPPSKMSKVTSTNVPHLPQTSRSNSTSTNRFVAPLSLRNSLQANRVVPSFSETSQSLNTSIPPTSKIGTQSTTKTIPTCSTPLMETLGTNSQPEAPSRTLPNPSAQYGPSNDNFDQPISRHPTNFEIDSKDLRLTNYINRLYHGRYREFKAELSAYYKLCKTHDDALANPPSEMLDRGVDQWVELCNHFNSDKFRKASSANIENRLKKKYNHRTGSRPLSNIVEEMAEDGSKFPEVDTFEFAYSGKNKCWTDSETKAQHDEMLAKVDEYLVERANEQQLPEDTPLEKISVDDPDVGLKIVMSVLGVKPGRQIRGLGDSRLRDIDTSSNVCHMVKELEKERAARKAADASRIAIKQRMKSKLNVVGQKFNSTLQSWHHSMQQLCRQVPGFDLPPFMPLSIEDDDIGSEENGFDEDNNLGDDM